MSKLPDVRGRIIYISSHAKQENLYAVYETVDRHYWTELAKCNQQEFFKSNTEGKCIEARELSARLFDMETVQPPLSQQEKESVHRRLQNYQRENADWQSEPTIQKKTEERDNCFIEL